MIRPAGVEDLDPLVRLEEQSFGRAAWGRDLLAAELDGPGRTVLVDVADGVVRGWASLQVAGDVADLLRIAVDPADRRRGVARVLLAEVLAAATLEGAERILLEVAADNVGALALYTGAGFGEIDRRSGYYAGGVDALVLARPL